MYGAEILPLAGAHFRAGEWRTRWGVGEEGHEDRVGFLDQEASEFVEPDLARRLSWRPRELLSDVRRQWPYHGGSVGGMGIGVVLRFEVLSEGEGGFDLLAEQRLARHH